MLEQDLPLLPAASEPESQPDDRMAGRGGATGGFRRSVLCFAAGGGLSALLPAGALRPTRGHAPRDRAVTIKVGSLAPRGWSLATRASPPRVAPEVQEGARVKSRAPTYF